MRTTAQYVGTKSTYFYIRNVSETSLTLQTAALKGLSDFDNFWYEYFRHIWPSSFHLTQRLLLRYLMAQKVTIDNVGMCFLRPGGVVTSNSPVTSRLVHASISSTLTTAAW